MCAVDIGEARGKPRRILLVDDSEEFRDLLVWAFVDEGFEVAAVGEGDAALEMLSRCGFDAVVLDMRLPDMSGAEVMRKMREAGVEIPVILVTGYAGCLNGGRFKELGFSEVLPKPVKIVTLIERVREVIKASVRRAGSLAEETV